MDATVETTDVKAALVIDPELFFLERKNAQSDIVPPDFQLLGVPVIVRVLRQLQDAGVERSTVVLPAERSDIQQLVNDDERIGHEVSFHFYSDSSRAGEEIKAAAQAFPAEVYLCRADLIAPAELFLSLAENIPPAGVMLAVRNIPDPRENLDMDEQEGLWRLVPRRRGRYSLIGAGVMAAEFVEELKATGDLAGLFSDRAKNDSVDVLELERSWAQTLRRRSDIPQAEKHLLVALRKPIDGFIARSINRRISIPISRRLVRSPLTPNQASAFTVVLALVAVYAVAQGGYFWMLLGGALFQFASIIDGVDGELARLKYQFSKYGEWFDTIADDLSNFLFFAGITYAVLTGAAGPFWVFWFGLLTLGCYIFITPLMYSYIIKYTDSGDVMAIDFEYNRTDSLKDARLHIRLLAFFKFLLKRDFFIFLILLLALFNLLPYMLVFSGIFAPCLLFAVFVQHLKKRGETQELVRKFRS